MNNLFCFLEASKHLGFWNIRAAINSHTLPISIITWKCPSSETLKLMEIRSNCYSLFLWYVLYCFIYNSSRRSNYNPYIPPILRLYLTSFYSRAQWKSSLHAPAGFYHLPFCLNPGILISYHSTKTVFAKVTTP